MISMNEFEKELAKRGGLVYEYLTSTRYQERFVPEVIHDSVYLYLSGKRGKSLRPAVLLFSCGAAGGDEEIALPAAAAIEVFHTWTLVHDDVIDRDCMRRGGYTVHEEFRRRGADRGYDGDTAMRYGTSIAILAGDVQQGWSVSLLSELTERGVDPGVVLHLVRMMETDVVLTLLSGQVFDVQYSKAPIESLSEDKILGMLWRKTGALYCRICRRNDRTIHNRHAKRTGPVDIAVYRQVRHRIPVAGRHPWRCRGYEEAREDRRF